MRYGVLTTGLIVGVMWGAWHFFVNFWGSGVTSGEISPAVFAPLWLLGILVGSLVPYRVLMVWVYERTGSLLVAMLMHVSLATFTFILTPPLGGAPYWVIGFAYAAALWVVVAAVAVAQGGHLSRQPLRRRET
jgi:membrane protease YdiL (CAAX protease family)